MRIAIIMALQAGTTPPPPPPIRFDLEAARRAREPAGEIVVTGERDRNARYRLPPLDDAAHADAPMVAETRVFGNAKLKLDTEAKALADGAVSNRVMLRLKSPF